MMLATQLPYSYPLLAADLSSLHAFYWRQLLLKQSFRVKEIHFGDTKSYFRAAPMNARLVATRKLQDRGIKIKEELLLKGSPIFKANEMQFNRHSNPTQ
jgi:hypothetical protein